MTAQPLSDPVPPGQPPARDKTGIPKNPGRRELGMTATLLFPNREIVDQYYVPIIYTACRTCYSEMPPEEIFRKSVDGEFDPAKMQKLIASVIESGHGSTIEHIVFTFAITWLSVALRIPSTTSGADYPCAQAAGLRRKSIASPSRGVPALSSGRSPNGAKSGLVQLWWPWARSSRY